MRKLISFFLAITMILGWVPASFAAVVSSKQVIAEQHHLYSKQQLLDMVDSDAVRQKLVTLGVNPEDAKSRIAQMTQEELANFHQQLEQLPAGGGVVGVIVTVLVVIALLDVLGITDVYPFIDPIT